MLVTGRTVKPGMLRRIFFLPYLSFYRKRLAVSGWRLVSRCREIQHTDRHIE